MAKSHQVVVMNNGSTPRSVAIYADYPDLEMSNGYSLIFLTGSVGSEEKITLEWNVEWGLGWVKTSKAQTVPQIGQYMSLLQPSNHIEITRVSGAFKVKDPTFLPEPPMPGAMFVSTDTSFSASDAENLGIAIFIADKPIFMVKGAPNTIFPFGHNPEYYICVTHGQQPGANVKEALILNRPALLGTENEFTRAFCYVDKTEVRVINTP